MTRPNSGLIGRMVMVRIQRNSVTTEEPCEVMACQYDRREFGGEGWQVLVLAADGTLHHKVHNQLTVIADQSEPYR